MYTIRKENEIYFVDHKIDTKLINTFLVTLTPKKSCSCKYFQNSKNYYNHKHILLVEYWIKQGCPKYAFYDFDKKGKIIILSRGIL